jgi:hypothetical protein
VTQEEAIRFVATTIHNGDVDVYRSGHGYSRPVVIVKFLQADRELAEAKANEFIRALKLVGGRR